MTGSIERERRGRGTGGGQGVQRGELEDRQTNRETNDAAKRQIR